MQEHSISTDIFADEFKWLDFNLSKLMLKRLSHNYSKIWTFQDLTDYGKIFHHK